MSEDATAGDQPGLFEDLDAYAATPRVVGLHRSPAGDRLVLEVSALDAEKTGYLTSLWELDPGGDRPARRLTRSAKSDSFAAFGPDGSVIFTSRRPDPSTKPAEEPPDGLWALPRSGEAFLLAARQGGFGSVAVAAGTGTLVATAMTMPGTADGGDGTADDERRTARRERKVTAILHQTYPVRYWSDDLGPDAPRLLASTLNGTGLDATGDPASGSPMTWHDLTGHAGHALRGSDVQLSDDGAIAVTGWQRPEAGGSTRGVVMAFDVASGERRVLLDDPDFEEFGGLALSADGRRLAVVVHTRSNPHDPGDARLAVLDIPARGSADIGDLRYVTSGWDRWPHEIEWVPDGSALIVTADDNGRCPVFRVELDGADPASVVRLTGDDGAYSDIAVTADGAAVYALRDAVDAPPGPVRIDSHTPDQHPQRLPSPTPDLVVPGRLAEVHATAHDGTAIRAWLCLPDAATEADDTAESGVPLALWIHGGPVSSWNSWSWRWNPWLMVARGYAVLLPDPGLSTGYGKAFVARGWGAWGDQPYTDVMVLTDAAERHPAIDPGRTVVMGGSFGGYLTNWILGHTDRFIAAVTHASLYALDQFGATTDAAYYWAREMTAAMSQANSPHLHIDAWRTPTLVIHGDTDYRVPIGEALRLWWDLAARSGAEDGSMPHSFLYFPDEGHWVLTPEHAKLWYRTIFAFLDQHVWQKPWTAPELLR